MWMSNSFDGFAKSPSVPRFAGLHFIYPRFSPGQAYSDVLDVRLIPQGLRALHLGLFTVPSTYFPTLKIFLLFFSLV